MVHYKKQVKKISGKKGKPDAINNNECPKKDKDGNCLVQGVYNDSEPIGGGG